LDRVCSATVDGKALNARGENMSGRIDFTMGFNAGKTAKAGGDSSYRVYVFGNFSGVAVPWEQSKMRKSMSITLSKYWRKSHPHWKSARASRCNFRRWRIFIPMPGWEKSSCWPICGL